MPGLSSGISADSPSGDAEGDSYSRSGIQSRLFCLVTTCPLVKDQQERSRHG